MPDDEQQAVVVRSSLQGCASGSSLVEVKKAAVRAERFERGKHAREDREAECEIAAWKEERGQAAVDALADEMPQLGPVVQQCSLAPGPGNGICVLHTKPQRAEGAKLVAASPSNAKAKSHTNMKSVLLSNWSAKHSLLTPAKDFAEEEEPPMNMCKRFGYCVCSPSGRLVHQLRNRFHALLMMRFPASGPARKGVLNESFVVVRFQSSQESGPLVWSDGMIVHIGCMYLSPFRPTYRKVELKSDNADGSMTILGTMHFLTDHVAMSCLEREGMRWRALFYTIRATMAPMMPFDPSTVTCTRYAEDPAGGQEVWPPPPTKRGAKRKHDDKPSEAQAGGGE